jgi:hypothetical protein
LNQNHGHILPKCSGALSSRLMVASFNGFFTEWVNPVLPSGRARAALALSARLPSNPLGCSRLRALAFQSRLDDQRPCRFGACLANWRYRLRCLPGVCSKDPRLRAKERSAHLGHQLFAGISPRTEFVCASVLFKTIQPALVTGAVNALVQQRLVVAFIGRKRTAWSYEPSRLVASRRPPACRR